MWAKDSGCSGWSVQDLVSHMACSFWLAVDPSALPDPGDLPAERAADIYVESRRSMTPPRGRGRLRIGECAGSGGARRHRRSGRRHSDRRCRHLPGVGRADNLRLRSLRPHPVRPFSSGWAAARCTAARRPATARAHPRLDRSGPAAAEHESAQRVTDRRGASPRRPVRSDPPHRRPRRCRHAHHV
ncbi:hypothetical protein [Mycobacterium avium]|uniref:hypothetical protein n=1 Tax=Mycobacterium avium TaxID=1764 RepID=UPI003AB014A4